MTRRKTPERKRGATDGPEGTGSAGALRQGNWALLVTLIIVIVVVIAVSEIAVVTLNVVPPGARFDTWVAAPYTRRSRRIQLQEDEDDRTREAGG